MNHSFFPFDVRIQSAILAGFVASFLATSTMPCHAAPPNDNLANAQVIPTDTFSIPGTLAGATQEAFEETTDYQLAVSEGYDLNATVWYSWTPSVSGVVQIDGNDTSGAGHTTPIFLFHGPGTPSSATFINGSRQENNSNAFSATVTANQPYLISVAIEKQATHSFILYGKLTGQSAPSPTPVVTMTVKKPDAVRSSDTVGKVLLELTPAPTTALTISYKTRGSAVNGVDYQMLSDSVTVPAGTTKATIKIRPLPSSTDAGTVKLKILPGDGYTVGDADKGTIEIEN